MVRRAGENVISSGKGPPAKRQKKKKSVPDEILKVLNVVYAKEWQNGFVRGFVIEEPMVGSEEGLDDDFFKKLQQVQLLDFFQKTCAVIAPRELIANFILDCKVEKVSSKEKKITYELPFRSKRTLQLTETRFAHILQLPTTESELTEQSSEFFDQIDWLGSRHISGSETYWSISEIKDPAMKDLYRYLSKWIFRLTSNIKISRSQILPVCEALEGNAVDWTQYLWPKFVSAIEKMKESAKHNKACKCSIAGLVSAILFEHTNELGGIWTQAWDAWGETETPEKVKAWISTIRRLPGTSQQKGVDSSRASSEKEKKKGKVEVRPRKKPVGGESVQTLGHRVLVEVAPKDKDKDVQDSATTLVTLGQIGRPPFLLTDVLGKGTVADFVNFNFAKCHEQLSGIGSAETQEMINHFIAQGMPVPKLPSFNPEGVRDIRLDDLLALRQTKPVEDGNYFQSGPVQRMIDQLAEQASVTSDVLRDMARYNGYLDYQLSVERKKFHDLEAKYSELEKRNKELQASADKSVIAQSTISQLQHEFQKARDKMSMAEKEHESKKHSWRVKKEELEEKLKGHHAREEQWNRERKAYEEKLRKQQKDLEASIISEGTTADQVADLRSKLDRALTKLSQQEYQKHMLGCEDADQEVKKEAEKASLDIVAKVLEATNRQIAEWSESLEKRQVAHGLKKPEEVEDTDDEDDKDEDGSENDVKIVDAMAGEDNGEENVISFSRKMDGRGDVVDGKNQESPEHVQAAEEVPEPKTGSSEASSRCTFRSTTRINTSR
ncbi:hypothetical protein MPTK1_4g18300 [Marchantia polymorpha subsp. ruderalis]|uniref:Uncharacterized protein n=2 Tax=Marchantia polymorpha TaxID=3197 RepID=A0AAF6BB78_MARPO|nr:hypothetical protein MARPO_0041s0111 [Marchantia polymorpha]BBN09262.1 hypothetical protein Mp_4g18300 [Marchantia polymorpha subsp. ruderalis]|eukprot:PTQ40250.1 hypothetical protein MARPO_0041s0111 [Marchantia polymorpha]